MATVTDFQGNVKEVKNLEWLRRNWKLGIICIHVQPAPDGGAHMKVEFSGYDAYYNPYLPHYYETTFASAEVLWNWLQRPIFYGNLLVWGKIGTRICKGEPMPPLPLC